MIIVLRTYYYRDFKIELRDKADNNLRYYIYNEYGIYKGRAKTLKIAKKHIDTILD